MLPLEQTPGKKLGLAANQCHVVIQRLALSWLTNRKEASGLHVSSDLALKNRPSLRKAQSHCGFNDEAQQKTGWGLGGALPTERLT